MPRKKKTTEAPQTAQKGQKRASGPDGPGEASAAPSDEPRRPDGSLAGQQALAVDEDRPAPVAGTDDPVVEQPAPVAGPDDMEQVQERPAPVAQG